MQEQQHLYVDQQLVFKSKQYVEDYAEKQEKILLVFGQDVIDVTDYAYDHPGGMTVMEDFCGQHIEDIIQDKQFHIHSNRAYKIINQLKIGVIDETVFENVKNIILFHWISMCILIYLQFVMLNLMYSDFEIDLNKPILQQISILNNKQYWEFLNKRILDNYVTIIESNDPKKKVQFYEEISQENYLWINLKTVYIAYTIISILLFSHLAIFYNVNFLQLWIMIFLGLMVLALGDVIQTQSKANYLKNIKYNDESSKWRVFFFIMFAYQNVFSIQRFQKPIINQLFLFIRYITKASIITECCSGVIFITFYFVLLDEFKAYLYLFVVTQTVVMSLKYYIQFKQQSQLTNNRNEILFH